MSDIRCIIVEDEPLAVKILKEYIAAVPFLELQGAFKDAILASEFLRNNHTDLIFLDIHLPKLKGLALLRTLANPPAVIVTTAYHQYAVEGFDLNVTDYLLKPFAFERFMVAINKVKSARAGDGIVQGHVRETVCLFVNVEKRKVKIRFADILYIESQREYVKIVTAKRAVLTKMSTREIETLLPSHDFKRIHRSFIVAVGHIDSYSAKSVEIHGVSIPIGREFSESLKHL